MQAYQSAPCPYCGATWNPPGAQSCANCRNQLPPPQPSYAPPGYAPQQGQPQGPPPGQGQQGYPYGPPQYPQQGYPQAPYQGAPAYPGQQPGQPGQQGQPYGPGPGMYQGQPGQQPQYQGYAPPGYGAPEYPGAPYGAVPGYPNYGAPTTPPGTTQLRVFGQTFTVPVVLPPVVVRYQQSIAYALVGLLGLLIVLYGILPAVASGQITAGNQAIATAVSHQSKVDAGFASFFTPDSSSNDLNVVKAQGTKIVQSINASLSIVQSDESALNAIDGRLAILQWVALPSKSAVARERQRLKTALDGLKQADTALTAGSNMGKVILPTDDAMIDFTKMYTALGKRDLVGAAAPYPDAQAKLQQAISVAQAPGVPAVVGKNLSALNDLLDNTENLIQALQNKDAAAVKKYSDALQASLKALSSYTLPQDYEQKTYGPSQKSYDAALKSLKG